MSRCRAKPSSGGICGRGQYKYACYGIDDNPDGRSRRIGFGERSAQGGIFGAVRYDSLHKGHFVVTKTGTYPMRTKLKLFTEWGITFGKPYEIAEKSDQRVEYADRHRVEEEIICRNSACVDVTDEAEAGAAASDGLLHSPIQEPEALARTKAPVRIE